VAGAVRQPRRARGSQLDLAAARALLLDLLSLRGPSGEERAVAERVVHWLRAAGCPAAAIKFDTAHRRTPLKGDVGNLIVKLPGTVRGPRRLLMAHLDTVPVCVGAQPVVKGRWVHSADPQTGLGGDDRAGVAVVLSAAREILQQGLPHPPLTFLFTIQEEVGLHGARCVSPAQLGRPRLAFNFDGGAVEKLRIGATSGYRLQIAVQGLASHAGVAPEKGVSALAIVALAVASLVEQGWHGLVEKGGRRGTCNVGVVRSGDATNVVAESAEVRAEARSHDAAFRQEIVAAIERAFRDAVARLPNSEGKRGKVTFDGRLDYEAFRLALDEPCVVAARDALIALGLEPQYDISNGGLDANWMTAHGIPTVTLGCGQQQIHTTSERLELPVFEQACRVALRLATVAD
jgi:tripeptide aminopeptidase